MKTILQFIAVSFLVLPLLCSAQSMQEPDSLFEKNIVIVLDNSGSMKQNDPDRLTKAVVKNFVNRIGSDTKLAVLVFDKDARISFPLSPVVSNDLKLKAEKSLDAVDYAGLNTDIPVAIERAIYELKMNSKPTSSRSIILLTDGYVATGDKGKDAEKQEWLKNSLTQEARKENIRIFAIAFTEAADFQLMQLLAQRTGGDYYRALTAKDIEPVFNKVYENLMAHRPAAEAQSSKEEQVSSQKTDYVSILGVVVVVIVGIIAIIVLVQSRSARRHLAVQGPSSVEVAKEGPVPPAKLIRLEDKSEHVIKKATYSIGRKKENDLCIPADTISGTHAFVKYRNNKFFVFDDHSSNSTYINGKKISPGTDVLVNSNDEVQFDAYKFSFILPAQVDDGRTVLRSARAKEEGGTVLSKKDPPAEKPAISDQDDGSRQRASGATRAEKTGDGEEKATELKQAYCPNHSAYKAVELCYSCKRAFCKLCVIEKDGKTICKSCAERISTL